MRDRPSATAYRVAMSRAAHQLLDRPRLLEDEIALGILGARGAADIRARPWAHRAPFARYLRAFVVARSRLAEDALGEAARRGVRQYVILGAGLDTSAYRYSARDPGLRIFEVDHPATQAWKRRQLAGAGVAIARSVTFVPVDFETQQLAQRLDRAGLHAAEPVFFSWLGVTMYLTRAAVIGTLGYIASRPSGSGVVFDYAVPAASLGPVRRLVLGAVRRRVAALGEPWRTFFEPPELSGELRALGFRQLVDFGPEELNDRLFRDRSDGLRVGGIGRVMSARS